MSARPTSLSVLDAIFTRRSVRTYDRRQLDDATIQSLLDAAVAAPTAMHAEPWRFVIVQDPAVLQKISDRAKASWLSEARKYQDLHTTTSRAGGGFAERLADPLFSIFYDAGTLIVICGKSGEHFVEADCWLAAENLMLAACGLGLGTCCIGSALPALNAPEIKAQLHIPTDVTAFAPIVVGIPAGNAAESTRTSPSILFGKK